MINLGINNPYKNLYTFYDYNSLLVLYVLEKQYSINFDTIIDSKFCKWEFIQQFWQMFLKHLSVKWLV